MNRLICFLLVTMISFQSSAQVIGRVDKKTKEFFVASNQKGDYRVFGYEYPNASTRKMICFSSRTADVRDNFNKCPLGSYFDSGSMKEGDRIVYLGPVGTYGKMNFISGAGKKTVFYLPKSSFSLK